MAELLKYIDSLEPLDWESKDIVKRTTEILNDLSKDSSKLEELVWWAYNQKELFSQFECHAQFDKITLYDDLDNKKLRVRLHVWHDFDFDLPHQHRYDFTAKVLKGGYHHIIYTASERLMGLDVKSPDARPYLDSIDENELRVDLTKEYQITKQFHTEHNSGDSYHLRSDLLHSTKNTKGCVSLFIRSPVIKESALEIELDTGLVYRRRTKQEETNAHINDVQMSTEKFKDYMNYMKQLEVF